MTPVAPASPAVAPAGGRDHPPGVHPQQRCGTPAMDGEAAMSEAVATGRRGREARRQARTTFQVRSLPPLKRTLPLYEVLNPEQLERLHEAAMRLVEEMGIEFREDEAAAAWRGAGAEVQGHRVRIPRELLMSLVAKAPERFTLHARNPERNA